MSRATPHFDYTGMTAAEILGRPPAPQERKLELYEQPTLTDAMGSTHVLVNLFSRYSLYVSGQLFETFPYTPETQQEVFATAYETMQQSLRRHLEAEQGKRVFGSRPHATSFPTATDLRR